MKPEYTKNEVYSLIASWAESCGFEIRYKVRDNEENLGFTRLVEDGSSYIQMYTNEEIYVELGKDNGGIGFPDWVYIPIGAANVLAHELAHQIFTNVSVKPFAKLFGISESSVNEEMMHNEDACDAFGNFLYVLADRIIKNAIPNELPRYLSQPKKLV